MGYSTRTVSIEPLLRCRIKQVHSWQTQCAGAHREIETRTLLNLLKYAHHSKQFNIREFTLEVSDHGEPRYFLHGPKGWIEFTLENFEFQVQP